MMNPVEKLLRGHLRGVRETIAAAASRADALELLIEKLARAPVAPAQPAQRISEAGWSEEEDEILRTHYPLVGAVGCAEMLPYRTNGAMRTRASKLDLHCSPNAKRFFCDQCETRVTAGQIAGCKSKFCKGKPLVAAAAAGRA